MFRAAIRVPVTVGLTLLLAAFVLPSSPTPVVKAQPADGVLVYHQITDLAEDAGSVGFPVLSADGTRAVFVEAPGTGDPAIPNRIYIIGADGSGLTEVDAYQSLCFCGSMVDISADGATVVSTDGVQARIADAGGARELVLLASGEITALVIAGDGETVFFIVRRDTTTGDGAISLQRGVWAINADGGNLRQVVGAEAVAGELGVTVEETGCCFHSDGHPLDAADSGRQVVFGAFAGGEEHVFAVDGDGGNLTLLRDSLQFAMRVAISGDGATAAYDVLPQGSQMNEVAVVPFAGGEPRVLAVAPASGFEEPLQLSADGSLLLVSPTALLIDTATGATRLLAVSITGAGGNHEAVLTDGLARATMDAEARRFLYVMRTVRCADCANLQEQLATLEIDPADMGEAPEISGANIEPASIDLEYASEATVEAMVETSNTVLGVGFAALLDGVVDVNVGHGRVLLDDGQNGDTAANDDVYTTAGIVHGFVVIRENDIGPRTVRIAVEVEGSDGRRHATAVDIGILTVGSASTAPATPAATG